jgi:hypothetical protein
VRRVAIEQQADFCCTVWRHPASRSAVRCADQTGHERNGPQALVFVVPPVAGVLACHRWPVRVRRSQCLDTGLFVIGDCYKEIADGTRSALAHARGRAHAFLYPYSAQVLVIDDSSYPVHSTYCKLPGPTGNNTADTTVVSTTVG